MRKVLWIVDGDKNAVNALLAAANYIRAQAICVRTTNDWLLDSIKPIQQQGFDVYGWRWPGVKAIDPHNDGSHHYALNEAKFVAGLIDAGLNGYIVDPECDKEGQSDCWSDPALASLANQFCDAIKLVGRKKNPNFLFGTTSGGTYPTGFPKIPWSEFVAHSDALFPQCYWYGDDGPEHGGTPQKSYQLCMASWKTVAPSGMKIIPMIGQIAKVQAAEIGSYQNIIKANALTELHFYSYVPNITQDRLDAMRALGTSGVGPLA